MADNRVYVIKNLGRRPIKYGDGTFGPVKEYITRMDDNGIPQPVGFSKDMAELIATGMSLDIEQAVIVCPDDLIVNLDDSARRLPRGNQPALQQMSEGVTSM